jgi:spermidine synthase
MTQHTPVTPDVTPSTATAQQWVIEYFHSQGTAFGLAIKEKLHEEQSDFQKIEIFDTQTFGRLMVLDGCMMVSDKDNFLYHEMITHPALFNHPNPKHVAIIGGGDCGTLKEVLKHPQVEKAFQIEIDERVTRVAETYFPDLCDSNNDPRASLLFLDGIRWIQERADESLDIILIDSTDPIGPAAGLFHEDFYRECFRVLKKGGILAQQSESPILHIDTIIKEMHHHFRQAGFSSTQLLPFPQPVYPSGWWSVTLAGKEQDVTLVPKRVESDQTFTTHYYNESVHQAALAMPNFFKPFLAKTTQAK